LAKYRTEDNDVHLHKAGEAFRRALELNPDLGLAHSLYSALEVEAGRSSEAMRRLLERTRDTHGVEPEVFTALVTACRYCGLLEASIAADAQARRLDPGIRTGVAYSHFLLADYDQAIATDKDEERFIMSRALLATGRIEEAVAARRTRTHGFHQLAAESEFAAVQGRREAVVEIVDQLARFSGFRDPEGVYFIARTLTRVGVPQRGLDMLEKVVEAGFHPLTGFARDSWLDPARREPRFRELMKRVEAQQRQAEAVFTGLGGPKLLGM
jgi:tetratricopeptide (TPR) repeat protein